MFGPLQDTGEAEFQRLIDAYSRLPRLEADISVLMRMERHAAFYPSNDVVIRWDRSGKVDALVADLWGNPVRTVADGRWVLSDSFMMVVSDQKGNPLDLPLLKDGGASSPLLAFIGPGDTRTKLGVTGKARAEVGRLVVQTRRFGEVTIYYVDQGGFPEIHRIEMANPAQDRANWLLFPTFGEKPGDSLTRHEIRLNVRPSWGERDFHAGPPKGAQFVDERKRGGPGGN